MLNPEQADEILQREVIYRTSRSGGKGGQNVNKVETRVELEFDILSSQVLTPEQQELILSKQGSTSIRIVSDSHRSQLRNKSEAGKKLIDLLNELLKKPKKRKPTKPGKAAKARRTKKKKLQSEKKALRRKNF